MIPPIRALTAVMSAGIRMNTDRAMTALPGKAAAAALLISLTQAK